MKQVVAPVISNSEVMPGVYLIWLESPQIASLAQPGQFVMVRCGNECVLPRPFSIYQQNDDNIALLVNVVGKGTQWLSRCQTGDSTNLFGPLGNDFSISSNSKNLLLVAGGIGIAPLHFLFEANKQHKHVSLIMGADTANYLYPGDNSDYTIVDNKEFTYTTISEVTEDGSKGLKGLATDLIPDYVDQADQVFACGPLPMYKTMAQMPELRNKPVQVSLEVRMGCGRGICYGCTVKTKKGLKQVCKDGPVFDLDDVLWEELDC